MEYIELSTIFVFTTFKCFIKHCRDVFPWKTLEISFLLTFIFLNLLMYVTGDVVISLWKNSLTALIWCITVIISIQMDRPFTIKYFTEDGLPLDDATQSFVLPFLVNSASRWVWAFGAMAMVSAIVPFCIWLDYCHDVRDSAVQIAHIIFTYITYYFILICMLYFQFYILPRQGLEVRRWLRRPLSTFAAEYASNHTLKPKSLTAVGCEQEYLVRVLPPISDTASVDSKVQSESTLKFYRAHARHQQAAIVLARAFANDPLITTWKGIGFGVTERERFENAIPVFAALLRIAMCFHMTFEVGNGKGILIVVPVLNGFEYEVSGDGRSQPSDFR